MSIPDFYLASAEGFGLSTPRRCVSIRRLQGEYRDDYLLVAIEPPLIGQSFGLGKHDLDQVVIATRHQGETLFPITDWPIDVHVARLLVPDTGQEVVCDDEIETIAWAELYPTEEAARVKEV